MHKLMSFMAGAVCGALVGAVTALLLTPASGSELIESVEERWEQTRSEARQAMQERRRELEDQYRNASRM
ncbi:YtxH domain-containing protein [Promineifilum sp.]|uniref:YtxH domain-containing protein n=1 Tax=Promineifilum sp. TaxID=2664178 RepID=UPI0035AF1EC3